MTKTTLQIKKIIAAGGSVNIDAQSKTTLQLKDIASVTMKMGTTLVIRNAESKTTLQLEQIAAVAPGKVMFII